MQDIYEYGYLTKKPETNLIFLPFGSIEVHGGYIPLLTDSVIAQACAIKFAQTAGGVVFPPVHAGVCPNTDTFPGTIGVSARGFFDYVLSILISVYKKGFKKIILVNVHKGNDAVLKTIVDEMYLSYKCMVYYINPYTFFDGNDSIYSGLDNDYKETSLLLASCRILDIKFEQNITKNKIVPKNKAVFELKKFGYVGYSYDCEEQHIAPREGVDAELGMRYIDAICGHLTELLGNLDRCLEDRKQ